MVEKNTELWDENRKLTSEALATLIVDALIHAKVVKLEDVETAITIATEEINARKAARDY